MDAATNIHEFINSKCFSFFFSVSCVITTEKQKPLFFPCGLQGMDSKTNLPGYLFFFLFTDGTSLVPCFGWARNGINCRQRKKFIRKMKWKSPVGFGLLWVCIVLFPSFYLTHRTKEISAKLFLSSLVLRDEKHSQTTTLTTYFSL